MGSFNEGFRWKCEPLAALFIERHLVSMLAVNQELKQLETDLIHNTSTRIFDWVDHLSIPSSSELHKELQVLGFSVDTVAKSATLYRHKGAQLPSIALSMNRGFGCYIKVEKIADFLLVRGLKRKMEGSLYSPYRQSLISDPGGVAFYVVERRGSRTIEPTEPEPCYLENYLLAEELWQTRPRGGNDELSELNFAIQLARDIVAMIGRDVAASVVLGVERQFWQSKNRAGQIQKARQDHLGLGWANHDHHTFRSSRRHFAKLVQLFEVLGFHCRERFYAGEEAGWGAQVMENEHASLVLFLDVDLTPDEVAVDFAHEPLVELEQFGTIGLWCALHGDSILKAGMHHLEAQFEFDHLREDLKKIGVSMMDPFSDFPYLRQAFTQGEIWKVDPQRIDHLEKKGSITKEQAEKFLHYGAIGSHLENLQRKEGYKGFNQHNVSTIIRRTDPRHAIGA